MTTVLTATADGKMLLPMIILQGATEKTIQKLRIRHQNAREGVDG